jgi:hypothetical protein
MPKCTTCPAVTKNEGHHVVPLNYGGRDDGLKIPICGNCHTEIHLHIENDKLVPPPNLAMYVEVGRRAKARFAMGELEARDRRASTLVNTNSPEIQAQLKYVAMMFNTKSREQTLLAALRFAATHAGRVKR